MDLQDELTDRFGTPGLAVMNLLMAAYLKSLAHQAWILQVTQRGTEIAFYFHPKAKLDASKFPELIAAYGGKLKLEKKKELPVFVYSLTEKKKTEQALAEDSGRRMRGNGRTMAAGYGNRSMASAYRMPRNAIQRKLPSGANEGNAGKNAMEPMKKTVEEKAEPMDNETIMKKIEEFLLKLQELRL